MKTTSTEVTELAHATSRAAAATIENLREFAKSARTETEHYERMIMRKARAAVKSTKKRVEEYEKEIREKTEAAKRAKLDLIKKGERAARHAKTIKNRSVAKRQMRSKTR